MLSDLLQIGRGLRRPKPRCFSETLNPLELPARPVSMSLFQFSLLGFHPQPIFASDDFDTFFETGDRETPDKIEQNYIGQKKTSPPPTPLIPSVHTLRSSGSLTLMPGHFVFVSGTCCSYLDPGNDIYGNTFMTAKPGACS